MKSNHSFNSTNSFTLTNELIEKELQEKISKRDIMILENIGLVYARVFQKFKNFPFEKEDLISYGIIGLTKAVDNYDSKKDITFGTYAVRCIDNEIITFLRFCQKRIQTVSIDKEISTMSGTTILESIEYDDSKICDRLEQKEEIESLMFCIEKLPKKYQKIVILYYGLFDNPQHSQRQIAEKLGVTASAIHRILSRALEILKINMVSLDETGKIKKKIKCNQL